jgi:phosphonopyruvate decarboxylase
MIKSDQLINLLSKEGLNLFTGIPCSIFKDFLFCLEEKGKKVKHVVSASEEEAISIGVGYNLATSKIPVIYMQNSGLANSVDVLTSLANKEVYGIPMLLLISWRGEPGKKDEPQHFKMGKITLKLLKLLDIPYTILSDNEANVKKEIKKAKKYLIENNTPYAIIIRKGLFAPYQPKKRKEFYSLTREEAIKTIVDNIKRDRIIVSTTGKTSRELFEYREIKKHGHGTDFYTFGSMGSSSAIALGIALQKTKKKVFVFDGDGSILMQMGILATVGHYLPKNFYHIIFDNNAFDSTGGQRTLSGTVDFGKIASVCGYKNVKTVSSKNELIRFAKTIESKQGPVILTIKVKQGARKDLGRPVRTPVEIKKEFMKLLSK